jgi:hypothetical protein
LDSNIASNHKILAVLGERDGYRAAFAFVCALGYCGGHGTGGFIAQEALGFVHARRRDADLLVHHRLWIDQPGGWLINDWEEYQGSDEEVQERRKRAQAGAAARWNGHERMSDAERAKRYRERKKQRDDS